MYYFKVPIFTKLSRIQNIIFIILQIIILIISITISVYRGCSYESINYVNGCIPFDIIPGNTMVTNRTYSNWQFKNLKKYSSELITDLYTIKYYNILSVNINGTLFNGNIVLSAKNNDYDAIFKDYLQHSSYYDFYYLFNKYVYMNNEPYDILIKDGYFKLHFLNNCSNNSVLLESNQGCILNNNTYNNINDFLNSYFIEKLVVPYNCHNCYINGINTFDEFITVLSKCISIFFMLNSFLIIIYIFIISKIKKSEIGYINNHIDNYKNNIYDIRDIKEVIEK